MYKINKKSYWRNQLKIKFTNEEFEYLWGVYTTIDSCMKCNNKFKTSFDKCLDHNHFTGEPRYILCRSCNNKTDKEVRKDSKSGEKYITDRGDRWVVDISFNFGNLRKSRSFNKNKYSFQFVLDYRNNLLKEMIK